MILSYLTHQKWSFSNLGLKIIATSSPIAYQDIIKGLQNKNELLRCMTDSYGSLDIAKTFSFVGDPLLSGDVTKKYLANIEKCYLESLTEDSRSQILSAYSQLEIAISDSLLLEDIPLEVSFDEDLKRLLKVFALHVNQKALEGPYGIIETVLKIHQTCNLKAIPVMCNITHYLDRASLAELAKLVEQMKLVLLLIEFTSSDLLVVPEEAQFYYIDQDLVDWY